VEHPFGTIKSWMGATHFQMKTLKNVGTLSASTSGKRDSLPRSAQAATAALDCWFAFQFQGSRSATLLAG
jgi:hypothetical protein